MFVLSVQQQTKRSTPGYNSHWAPTYTVWVHTACSLSTYYMCSTMKSARDITKKTHSHWFKSDIRSKTVQECWAIFHGFRLRQYNNGERGTAPNTDNNQTQTTNGVYSQQTECTHNKQRELTTNKIFHGFKAMYSCTMIMNHSSKRVSDIYILYFKHPLLSSSLWRTHTFHCHWHFLTYGSLWFFHAEQVQLPKTYGFFMMTPERRSYWNNNNSKWSVDLHSDLWKYNFHHHFLNSHVTWKMDQGHQKQHKKVNRSSPLEIVEERDKVV